MIWFFYRTQQQNAEENDQCSSSLRSSSSQHTQRNKQDYLIQRSMEQSNHNLEDVKSFTYVSNMIDEHGESGADVNARIGKARAVYLQLKNIWNSKQLYIKQHQGQDSQYKCQGSSTVYWGGNLENYGSHHPEDTSVC
ncbi:unnamed protein product [Schistosoma mattheei]|uniref:Uncharacterized protein n=1 Tax=Schistosoma mattheei TaxID=31246 RepID=A0A183PRR1_9TREM|nr:unnamed protein product [Schistosoma mattheei]